MYRYQQGGVTLWHGLWPFKWPGGAWMWPHGTLRKSSWIKKEYGKSW